MDIRASRLHAALPEQYEETALCPNLQLRFKYYHTWYEWIWGATDSQRCDALKRCLMNCNELQSQIYAVSPGLSYSALETPRYKPTRFCKPSECQRVLSVSRPRCSWDRSVFRGCPGFYGGCSGVFRALQTPKSK